MACQSLLQFQCDMVLAGGVTVIVPHGLGYLALDGVMSPDGHCRAFDAAARGTVEGSGAGVVVLKRLADAVADGDTIHAVIRGFATNNDGAFKMGFTAPSSEGQVEVIATAPGHRGGARRVDHLRRDARHRHPAGRCGGGRRPLRGVRGGHRAAGVLRPGRDQDQHRPSRRRGRAWRA